MVGDSAVDVETGRAAGVFTVGVLSGFDETGLRRHPPDVVLRAVDEVPALLARREVEDGEGGPPRDPTRRFVLG